MSLVSVRMCSRSNFRYKLPVILVIISEGKCCMEGGTGPWCKAGRLSCLFVGSAVFVVDTFVGMFAWLASTSMFVMFGLRDLTGASVSISSC